MRSLGLTRVKLQQENAEQTGILRGTNSYPRFLGRAPDEVVRNRIWMRCQFFGNRVGYPDSGELRL